ncbi:unnamed protein product [Symbiodinium sp. KB8]|nr:unnamed protein product [Symbiodinium sp. KB8]
MENSLQDVILLLPPGLASYTWRLRGVHTQRASDAVLSQLPQDWPSTSDGIRAVCISVSGHSAIEIQNALHIILRRLEDVETRDGLGSPAAGGSASGLLGLAVQLTPSIAVELRQRHGSRLKALCRSCPSRLRASLVGYDPPLLLLSGLPEALHAALPQVRDMLQLRGPGWHAELRDAALPAQTMASGVVRTVPAIPTVPVGDYSLWVWLKSLDGGVGEMLVYCDRLNELFQARMVMSRAGAGVCRVHQALTGQRLAFQIVCLAFTVPRAEAVACLIWHILALSCLPCTSGFGTCVCDRQALTRNAEKNILVQTSDRRPDKLRLTRTHTSKAERKLTTLFCNFLYDCTILYAGTGKKDAA